MKRAAAVLVSAALCALSCAAWGLAPTGDTMKVKDDLAKFAPVKIAIDPKLLDAKQKRLVRELVEASRLMDEIFLRQVYEGNVAMRGELKKNKKEPALYEYFQINFGPWDRLDHDMPFIDGVPQKPTGAAFYPADMKKEEFQDWVKAHPDDRELFESNFTVIRRSGDGLSSVPYSEEYGEFLAPAAEMLRKAAKLSDNESLSTFLRSRADAFLTNDYYESDVNWVRLKDHAVEAVIGPYEVYEDNLFGYKAAFEAFVTRVDPQESERLSKVVAYLDELERHLPIEDKYKGIGRSLSSPIVVAHLIYSGGEAKAGIQTLAFNLPNDERVREREGSKKVMLKNVQAAKFEKILLPVAKLVMRPADAAGVDFEAFFAHTLLHEVSHGIGPGKIRVGGRDSTVSRELKDLYSIIEECKADALGVYNALYLSGKGLYPESFADKIWPTYLAGLFRSMRFGIKEAHGGGNAIQFNYLRERGGITYDEKSGRFGIERKRIESDMTELARDVLMIEAKGDYAAAKKFVEKYRTMSPEVEGAVAKLNSVPVDIRPIYSFK